MSNLLGLLDFKLLKFSSFQVFNKFVNVIYVKYGIDSNLKQYILEIKSGDFKVSLRSKNTPRHQEKIGFDVMQAK